MLSNIKVKFLNVSKSVKFLQQEENKDNHFVNLDAGAEILEHFEEEWKTLHENNEKNAKKAGEVAREIENVYHATNTKIAQINIIGDILTNPNLINNINGLSKQLKDIYSLCDSVERGLIELENIIDEIEFQNLKKQHEFHLKKYEEKKKDNLRTLELELEEIRKEDLKQQEKENSKKMEERQKVFQEAFRTDLELFKTLGEIPKVELNKNKQPSALLEEIQLDFDEKELDQFLEEN